MRAGRAAALGLAQGVAEVVPVSSSAQLVLLPWLLGWEQPADRTTFGAALHAGSCAGIAWTLRDELRALPPRDLALLAAASAPAAAAGALAADAVEQRLGRPPQLAALLAGAGALMWWADRRAGDPGPARPTLSRRAARRKSDPGPARPPAGGRLTDQPSLLDTPGAPRSDCGVTPRQALLAGLAQVAALAPGVSRSGATLTALRTCGVPLPEAERWSLLMSLPVTAGAAGLTLARSRTVPPGALPGAAAAAVAGALAARHLRPRRSLRGPALYRLGLAAVVARRLVRKGAR